MDIQKISKHVGHDGKSYFCWDCGQAGFDSPSHVNGHQSVCPKRQIPINTTTTPITTPLGGGGGGGGTTPTTRQKIDIPVSSSNTEIAVFRQELSEMKADMKAQYAKAFNEGPHLQAVNSYGFLGISANVWIGILIGAYIVYKMGQESTCMCAVNDSSFRRSNSRLGSSIQDRVADKAINYGISKLFK
jgi:hypothetical protein